MNLGSYKKKCMVHVLETFLSTRFKQASDQSNVYKISIVIYCFVRLKFKKKNFFFVFINKYLNWEVLSIDKKLKYLISFTTDELKNFYICNIRCAFFFA